MACLGVNSPGSKILILAPACRALDMGAELLTPRISSVIDMNS
jgi:hypothetical protein